MAAGSHRDETKLAEDIRSMFNKFDRNLISIVFAKAGTDKDKLNAHWKIHNEILASVNQTDEEFQECFFDLVVSEYKEYLYKNLFDPCFEIIERDIMLEYGEFIDSKEELQEILFNHRHDPTHFLFNDGKAPYDFYEIVESRGYSILELDESEEALYDFNSDIICDYCDEFVL